ncbi:MAG: hypothetical protein IJQ01_08100 [Selenomonadaceae bacterium]|nr:hypothetical protein [Selenomonadaceae bacterium]
MNGSENCYAGALFFALISLGAILKVDDIFGWLIGAGSALVAAISLRRAFVKAAQAGEEDHQRLEIQFQQLRSKVIETSEANITAMNSVHDAAKLIQENMEVIRVRLAELDNLAQLTECAKDIQSSTASLEENSSALNVTLEKEFETINTLAETNKDSLQNILKLLQLIRQILENPAYVKDLENINSMFARLLERIETQQDNAALSRQDLSTLKQIAAKIK